MRHHHQLWTPRSHHNCDSNPGVRSPLQRGRVQSPVGLHFPTASHLTEWPERNPGEILPLAGLAPAFHLFTAHPGLPSLLISLLQETRACLHLPSQESSGLGPGGGAVQAHRPTSSLPSPTFRLTLGQLLH